MVRLGKLSEGPRLHTTMSEGPNFRSFLNDKQQFDNISKD